MGEMLLDSNDSINGNRNAEYLLEKFFRIKGKR
jgi:hypothetical protein